MIGIEDRPPTEREHVVLGGPRVETPWVETPAGRAEWAAAAEAADQPDPCVRCGLEGHVVRWRVYPHPGEFPAPGVLDELGEGCACCTWGVDGLVRRAERESVDDRDIQIEHRERDGRWVRFERRL